jgi:hypothetical protein
VRAAKERETAAEKKDREASARLTAAAAAEARQKEEAASLKLAAETARKEAGNGKQVTMFAHLMQLALCCWGKM